MELQLSLHKNLPMDLADAAHLFADRPYCYELRWRQGTTSGQATTPQNVNCVREKDAQGGRITRVGGTLGEKIRFEQTFLQPADGAWLEETLTLTNIYSGPVHLEDWRFGFRRSLEADDPGALRWIAVPFRVQVDGKVHDYSVPDLLAGRYTNSNDSMEWGEGIPPLVDEGRLRSEGWLLAFRDGGLLIAKYNNDHIEMSISAVEPAPTGQPSCLRFGGISPCLYGDPQGARLLNAGQTYRFGVTRYEPWSGGIPQGYECYRAFLRACGHGFPADYNPPVNWNELYDVGWYHSDPEKLKQFYTREALLEEARKAAEIGCELLYLDPGWERCEGTTLWDEQRLGTPSVLVRQVKKQFGLDLGYRTIGFLYRDEFPKEWYWVPNPEAERILPTGLPHRPEWRCCSCCTAWQQEKIRRIRNITRQGMKFMMFDEFAWYGPCYSPDHGHVVPTTAEDHVRAVYGLIEAMHEICPDVLVEAHDPVWPWRMRCLPTYFRQGFAGAGSYEENWGFEFMWECIRNLREGPARALYYYALGCDIPLYLHISMVPDNDACLFFWWAASTVRHLGIGGKYHHHDQAIREKYCPDPELRWTAYKAAMKTYKALKPYFVRGVFHGLHEESHLHTLPNRPGGVLNLFNLSDQPRLTEVRIPAATLKIQPGRAFPVNGTAEHSWDSADLVIRVHLPALSPCVVALGDAAHDLPGVSLSFNSDGRGNPCGRRRPTAT